MGSPRFRTGSVGSFEITDAWFPPGASLPRHTHDRTVLAVVLDGAIDSRLSRRTVECTRADVWTEPAGESHANQIGASGARVLIVQPDPAADILLRPARALLSEVHHFNSPAAARLAGAARAELEWTDPISRLALEGLSLELLAVAARAGSQGHRHLPPAFARALDRIHDEFRARLTVTELAEEARLHPTYFARVFRKRTGVSVSDYIAELRVRWAEERIANSDAPLGQIGLAAGFSDQSHFIRTFKRRRGHTPGQYRARCHIHPNRVDPFNLESD